MDSDEKLRRLTKWKRLAARSRMITIGKLATSYVEKRVIPDSERFEKVNEIWTDVVPEMLREHCDIEKITKAQMLVLVDSPSYANQLQLRIRQILDAFDDRAPRASIRSIRIVIGKAKAL